MNIDVFVKSPSAALRFNFVVVAHIVSALHSSVFARLASGAFYKAIGLANFYETINIRFPEMSLDRSFQKVTFSSAYLCVLSALCGE